MDLSLKENRWPFSLEKWYIDAIRADGAVLLVYLARINLLGLAMARVTAELFQPDRTVIRDAASASRVRGGADRLDFGPAQIDGDCLTWHTPEFSGRLRYYPRHKSTELRRPFLQMGHRSLEWRIEIPDADVDGKLSLNGSELEFRGRGYRDRVWFDLLPWKFPLRRLRWGRAFTPGHAATWVHADMMPGSVSCWWRDGTVGSGESVPVEMGPSRPLLESAVADLEGLRLGFFKPLLRRLTGDPYEVKWLATAQMAGENGFAIHEEVTWR